MEFITLLKSERAKRILEQSWKGIFLAFKWIVLAPLALLAFAFAFPAYRLAIFLFRVQCTTQDLLSERLRRWKYGNNARNSAAQLPEEVQLEIFHLLRTRARFGSDVYYITARHSWPSDGYKSRALGDLASARLVCRRWYHAATLALYTDISLATAAECVGFAHTLVAHPRLARFVRRLKLPPALLELHLMEPALLWNQVPDHPGIRWLDLKAACNRLLVQCTAATHVTYCGEGDTLYQAVSQLGHSHRLTHFSCYLPVFPEWSQRDRFGPNIDPFAATAGLDCLESWSLTWYCLPMAQPGPAMRTLNGLHTLRMEKCFVERIWFLSFLGHLPNLRTFDWRHNFIFGVTDAEPLPLTELLQDHISTIQCCTFQAHGHYDQLTISNMGAFVSLRSLTIDEEMLQRLIRAPPHLAELIVVFTPYYFHFDRRRIFSVAQHLKYHLPLWLDWYSPSLHSIQLWDMTSLSGLQDWAVAACILRDCTQRYGVEVAVNLTLLAAAEREIRRRFRRRERFRRLKWQDVI